ncbi:hypothetical protein ACVWXQ_005506 [Bradyrhizobium sp. S3.14.4]
MISDTRPVPRWMPSFGNRKLATNARGDADHDVANDAEPAAAHHLAGEPAGDEADEQDDDEALARNVHKLKSLSMNGGMEPEPG